MTRLMKYYGGGGVVTFDMERFLPVHNQELLSLRCSARRPVLVDISIKFHKNILDGFKVIERTRFCHRNCHLHSSRGIAQTTIQELRFLCFARRPMLVNISLKFHEDILKGFNVIERTRFCHRNCHLHSSRGIAQTTIQELRFLCFARRPMLVNISLKFHEDILKGFNVIERTRFCH